MPLSPPPRDADNEVIPHDHNEIIGNDGIIRRISPEHVVDDIKTASGKRISKLAFQASTDGNCGMSVDIEKLIIESGSDPKNFVTQPPFIGSVIFEASFLRSKNLKVGYDPLDDNPHHGEVWGNFTEGTRKALLRTAKWFVPIANVDLKVTPPVAPGANGSAKS